ncbi:MAG: hypothetical protein LBO09_07455 [Candidatus Peribacteria bacterium]|jgi:hypothetical protein|nr:hypothetical protein [Candidatus Peribacteria bacterium]
METFKFVAPQEIPVNLGKKSFDQQVTEVSQVVNSLLLFQATNGIKYMRICIRNSNKVSCMFNQECIMWYDETVVQQVVELLKQAGWKCVEGRIRKEFEGDSDSPSDEFYTIEFYIKK